MNVYLKFPSLLVTITLFVLAIPLIAFANGDQSSDRPTIVLVHGAWAGPSSWDGVVHRLNDEGFRTATPTLGLTSLPDDVANVDAVLNQIPGRKVLVGHSYGGAVISAASYGRSDVSALVYSAAFVPDAGDTLAGLGTGFTQSGVIAHLVWTGTPFGFGSYAGIDPAYFSEFFAQDLPAGRAEKLNDAQRPIAFIPVFVTPSGPVGWHTIPSWYQVSGADRMIDPNQERFMAARAGATTIEFPTASHVGGITVYARQFTQLVERAIETTSENEQ